MLFALLLLVVGLLFIFIEFFLPGGIMAIIGTLVLLGSIIAFAEASGSFIEVLLFVILIAVLLFFLIKYTLKFIQKSKNGYSIYLHKDQEGYRASTFDPSAVGKQGIVSTDLKPAGYIIVDGKKHQALSISGYIPQGEEVIVLRGEEESLIVKNKKDTS